MAWGQNCIDTGLGVQCFALDGKQILFLLLLSSADFLKMNFLKNPFMNTVKVLNSLDTDQDWHIVSPDLGPN